MMLLLLAVVRNDLLNDWRRSLPADTPNFFFINIPPDEAPEVRRQFLEERGAQHARVLPMVRARMTHINGKPIDRHQVRDAARPRVRRPRPEHHLGRRARPRQRDHRRPLVHAARISASRWCRCRREYMEELNLKLGDELQFDIAGETRTARDLERAQGEVGQLPAELLPDVRAGPARGLAGHVDDGRAPGGASNPKTIADLVRRFPSVSVFNVDDLLAPGALHHRQGAGRGAERIPVHAVGGPGGADRRGAGEPRRTALRKRDVAHAGRESLVRCSRVCSRSSRRSACCRACWRLPARRSPACTSPNACCRFPYTPDPWVWFYGLVGGGLLVCLAGWLATRSVVNQPPVLTLRSG